MYLDKSLPIKLFRSASFVLLLALLLNACADAGTNVQQATAQKTTPAKGPLQLYDRHGELICQMSNASQPANCLGDNAAHNRLTTDFISYAVSELANDLHSSPAKLSDSGLHVSTTLDLALQGQIQQKARSYIESMKAAHNMSNAAVVALNYHDGSILSLFGSLDGQLNVATQDPRQPGSVFKPFVYATAFDQGTSPGEVTYDGPIAVGTPAYSPMNYDHKYHGYISYRTALQNSFNIPAVKLLAKIGIAPVVKKVEALGLKEHFDSPGYSMALGTYELSLLDTTNAYGTIANGGIAIPPHAIDTVTTADGHTVYQAHPQGMRALSPEAAFMMTDVLSDNRARAYEFGSCSPLLLYSTTVDQCNAGNPGAVRPAAATSGIMDTFRDTWTVGYTSDFVVGAWTGNSNTSMMYNINSLDGAATIWHGAMLLAESGAPIKQFPGPPSDVVKKTVSYPELTTSDWYLAGK